MDVRFCGDSDRRGHSGAVAVALLAVSLLGAAGTPDDSRERDARRKEGEERLQRVRGEIDELRRRLDENESATGSVLDMIEELDLRMALMRRESESLGGDLRLTSERARLARQEEETLRERLRQTESDLRGYLRETYKIGPARYVRIVTAASSPAQVAAGYRAIEAMSLGEAERVETFRADRERLDAVVADLQSEEVRLRDLRVALEGKGQDLADLRDQKRGILTKLQSEQMSQKTLLGDLLKVEQEIRGLLDRLAESGPLGPVPSLGLERYRGQLDWPAKGRLVVPFGNVRHPRFSTEVPHPGIDIAAPPGQEVRAVFDGRVLFSDWFKGYGQMVVIDHGDSYLSIYGHVDERLVTAGQNVSRGEVIARSGQGGSFDQPGLYFEIRHEGRPEDPARWLRAAPGVVAEHERPSSRGHRGTRRIP